MFSNDNYIASLVLIGKVLMILLKVFKYTQLNSKALVHVLFEQLRIDYSQT